ncbi:uncharacterized protein LOC104437134 [Eucalyptus grandis]|uniref:uncharacterized protein LOC104437134 n=1 Tax=Eucalyptus grandis TaxID=71139 RepID=UPI00192EBFF2|nr:uncharacterized protein LOC104437134 [Eucalyptus grandis]
MASKDLPSDDPAANTETGGETVAARRKRSRRVSFADVEITSVHIFKRDEDYYDTTPPSDPNPDGPGSADAGEARPLFRDLDHSDDSRELTPSGEYGKEDGEEEEDADEVGVGRKSFLRPIGSPSPGSSTFGSATSNDEDNFFGPVSASFIRPGRLSDSAASDENHDVTMDSTAFSMHFRSLARSNSGMEKTPTSIHLTFDEKTPSEKNTSANSGSFMMLTNARKLSPESASPMHNVQSDGKDSNEMSLIGNNPNRYDYGRLSPTLDALLAEGSQDLQALPGFDVHNANASATFEVFNADEGRSSKENVKGSADNIMSSMGTDGTNQITVAVYHELDKANSASEGMCIENVRSDLSNMVDSFILDAPVYQHIHTPNQTLKLGPVFQHVTEATIKENSPWNGSQNLDSTEQDPNRLHTSHLKGSISSLAAKRRQLFLDTVSSPANFPFASPSAKMSGSLLSKERTQHGLSLSSMWKNIPKFGNLDSSPSSTRLKEIKALKLKLSGYLSSSPSSTGQARTSKDVVSKRTETPVAVHDNSPMKTPIINKMNNNFSQAEKTLALARNRESPGRTALHINHNDQPITAKTEMAYPNNFSMSGGGVMQPRSMSESSENTALVSLKAEPPLDEFVVAHRKDNEEPIVSHSLSTSPVQRLNQELLPSGNDQSTHNVSMQQNWYRKSIGIDSDQFESPLQSVASGGYPIEDVNKIKSHFLEKISPRGRNMSDLRRKDEIVVAHRKDNEEPIVSHRLSTSPVQRLNQELLPSGNDQSTHNVSMQQNWYRKSIGIDSDQIGSPLKSVSSGGSPIEDVNKIKSQFLERISPRGRNMSDLWSLKQLKDLQTEADGVNSIEEVSFGERKVSSLMPDSTYPNKSTDVPLPKKSLSKEPVQNDNKEIHNMRHYENMQSTVEESISTSKSDALGILSNDNQQEPCHSARIFSAQEMKESHHQKRKGDALEDGDLVSKVARTTGSSEIKRSEGYDVNSSTENPKHSCMGRENSGDSIPPRRNWKDVFTKFLDDSRKIPSPLVDKLDMRTISVLDEMLVLLQKVKNYELLSSDIQTKKADQSRGASEKRLYEINSLLYKALHEKERLRLNCVKRERLQKTEQILRSSIQESQALKLIMKKTSLLAVEDGSCEDHQCSTQSENGYKVAHNPTTSMKQEIEILEKKIENLTKSLNRFCKMKGELDCVETIGLINNFMKKRMCCRFVRLDMQLWKVSSFESKSGHHDITLDYLGLIYQRLSLTAHPVPSLTVSNKLADTKIEQNYPNMAARTAFAFVFNSETVKNYATSRCLAKETQMTHLLLRNLLDVLEELLLARLEIKSLTHTSFSLQEMGNLICCFPSSTSAVIRRWH